ncbi:MAG: acylphosphatase [Candidatus Cloacimonetes bacterium]|jgi:acylphosphatase|nr:acylphosphatase [Candidatus Cloacimonadota bacterium]MDX9950036.1 acylphosphatase [Candidatus Syntrophosphaera sp.]NLN84556.1 acylphosphatase [Candidatus Cloacimonadota bacterium]
MLTWEILVTGRVQGVGFRRYVQNCARHSRIGGWTRNLRDGSVLIEATGERQDLELFVELVRAGRGFIRVRGLSVNELDNTIDYEDFSIR